jgi:hypothetical protein
MKQYTIVANHPILGVSQTVKTSFSRGVERTHIMVHLAARLMNKIELTVCGVSFVDIPNWNIYGTNTVTIAFPVRSGVGADDFTW